MPRSRSERRENPYGQRPAEAAQALQARAFTRGRDIYFGAGEFRPNDGAGQHLLAHELVHTIQQAGADASAMPIMRAPVEEDAEKKRLRLSAARDAANAIDNLRIGLTSGQLWKHETPNPQAQGYVLIETSNNEFQTESVQERATRLKNLAADLIIIERILESGPIPESWYEREVQFPSRGRKGPGSEFGTDPGLVLFYAHYLRERKGDEVALWRSLGYINRAPIPEKRIAPTAFARPHKVYGLYISVPDPENKPLSYTTLSTFAKTSKGVVVDVWQDDFGYFYFYLSAKHYLPKRPESFDVAQ